MKRRYLNPTLLADAESTVGNGLEFKPEHDRVNAGKPLPPPVELTPVGPLTTVYEFRPEHDHTRTPVAADAATTAPGVESHQPIHSTDRQDILECLKSGPKRFSDIRRYLYEIASSEMRSAATSQMLGDLTNEGLVECKPEGGQIRLTTRGECAADNGSTQLRAG